MHSASFQKDVKKCQKCVNIMERNCWNDRLQNLVSADREGNWDNHIQVARDFIEADICAMHHGTLKVFDNYI